LIDSGEREDVMMYDLETKLKEIIIKNTSNLAVAEITETVNLKSIGVNSIDYIKIIVAVEKEFGFELDEQYLTLDLLQTVADFAAVILQNSLSALKYQ
jgi:acyl carrier protein